MDIDGYLVLSFPQVCPRNGNLRGGNAISLMNSYQLGNRLIDARFIEQQVVQTLRNIDRVSWDQLAVDAPECSGRYHQGIDSGTVAGVGKILNRGKIRGVFTGLFLLVLDDLQTGNAQRMILVDGQFDSFL